MILARQLNDSITMFFAVMATVGIIILTIIIFNSIIKEQKKNSEEKDNYIEGALSKAEIMANISSYISRSPNVEFSLLYVDIDKFTSVMESLGKEEAKYIVKDICKKILDILPARVEMSRIADDEFLIFFKGDYTKMDATNLAKKIITIVTDPIKLYNESKLNLTCSISICYYPIHGSTTKQLKESLKIAMYVCKREGGNKYKVYNQETSQIESENIQYYQQIKNGIKNEEFTLYYQPMIDNKNRKIYGVEGLLRWNHPELGLLSPYKFINIMEQTGDIYWVGLWGLECLVKQYLEIKRKYNDDSFVMSLNLSPKQLSDQTIASEFQKIIKKYKVKPSNIILEIEEFALYEKNEIIKRNIKNLIDIGFTIAVDGFGLDYEAIKHIESMQIGVVKLGKEFLDTETDEFLKQRFINLLVEYSQRTNKTIIGEGIENESNLIEASKYGLYVFQGYHFAKPMSSKDIIDYIINFNNQNNE